jgi:hypothetical protein
MAYFFFSIAYVGELFDFALRRPGSLPGVTIPAFSARLRQGIELDSLTAELLAVVDATMQPTRVSLWLRPPQRAAGTPPGPTPSPL